MFDGISETWSSRARRSLRRAWPLLSLLVLTGICLSPAIETGYWAEDIYYSAMIPSLPILDHSNWFAETVLSIKNSVQVGRFYPITPLITAVAFKLFQHVAVYKCYIIAVTLLDLVLFHALIRRMSGCRRFADFATACTVVLFQFRLTVDPFLGYYAQIQWVTAAFFVCLICLHRALVERKWIWLIASVLTYFLCTLTYEMTYPLVIIPLFLISWSHPGWKRGLRLAGPFVISVGFSAGMTVLVRWYYPSNNYVHATDFGVKGMFRSLGCQLSAGLPLSYYFADPLRLFSKGRDLRLWLDWLLQPRVVVVGLASLCWVDQVLRQSRRLTSEGTQVTDEGPLVGLGVGLVIAPTVLIAISPYHRLYLSLGVGWIGVMVQYYGVGLLLALGCWRFLAHRIGDGSFVRWKTLIVAAVLSGVLAVTYRANIEVATAINAPPGSDRFRQYAADHGAAWHWHRLNLIAALDAGVLGEDVHEARVELANQYPFWHDNIYGQYFYTKQTGRRIETWPSHFPSHLSADAPTFHVSDMVRDRKVSFVVVTPVGHPRIKAATGRVFVKHPSIRADGSELPLILLVNRADAESESSTQVFRLGKDLSAIQVGSGWGLFALPPNQIDNLDRLRLVDDPRQMASWIQKSSPDQSAARPASGSIKR